MITAGRRKGARGDPLTQVGQFLGAIALLFGLSGCDGAMPNSNPAAGKTAGAGGFVSTLMVGAPDKPQARKIPKPLARVRLAGGDVVVAGPDGYCLDPVTVENSAERGFVLIASCHILSGGIVGASVEPVLVTVTVGPKGTVTDIPSPQQLAVTAKAPLLGGGTEAGFVVAHLGANGDAVLDNGDARHWRGAFLQGDRLVGLALYAPKGSAYAASRGGAFLDRVHAKIVSQSPGGSAPAPALKKNRGEENLLGRLFDR